MTVAGGRTLQSGRLLLAEVAGVGPGQPVGLRELHLGAGALERLPDAVRARVQTADAVVAVLRDGTTKLRARGGPDLDATIVAALRAVPVQARDVPVGGPHAGLLADEQTLDDIVDRTAGAALVLTVGSGTLTDLGKAAGARHGIPHVVVQTAASVNGYADDQSVLLVQGVKTTVASAWPEVLIADTAILGAAPRALTAAGLGDLLSAFTACADWATARAIGIDRSYDPRLVALLHQAAAAVLPLARGLEEGDEQAVTALTEGLTLGGLVMGVAGRTAPSSGTEHTVSHLLDMAATAQQRPHGLHGAQVGVSSLVAAAVWEHVAARLPDGLACVRVAAQAEARQRVLDAFAEVDASGRMGEQCWRGYAPKRAWLAEHVDSLRSLAAHWQQHAELLRSLLPPVSELRAALRACGGPVTFTGLDPVVGPATARWAVAHGHLMRARFGVVDLAEALGAWTDDDVTAVLERVGAA